MTAFFTIVNAETFMELVRAEVRASLAHPAKASSRRAEDPGAPRPWQVRALLLRHGKGGQSFATLLFAGLRHTQTRPELSIRRLEC